MGRSPCVQVPITELLPIKRTGGVKGLSEMSCVADNISSPCIPLVALVGIVPFLQIDLAARWTASLPDVGTAINAVGRGSSSLLMTSGVPRIGEMLAAICGCESSR